MASPSRLLILGGTHEALALAKAAAALPGLTVVTSLAGRTATPRQPAGELRIGGFGGAAGLADYLDRAAIDFVIDATHPFATVISGHAQEAAARAGRPLLRLLRPAWTPEPGERWIDAADAGEAARLLPAAARRVFLAIGRKDVGSFAALSDVWFLLRSVDPYPMPLSFAQGLEITGRGPFNVEAEKALLAAHRIDALVSRNSGGAASRAKLDAARALGLPVVMIRRPAMPDAPSAASVEDALIWLRRVSGAVA